MGRKPKPGQVIKSRGEKTTQGLTVKEWQRTPKQLLSEYCQGQKRPRPLYKRAPCNEEGRFRARVVLPDPKRNREKDVVLATAESYASQLEAEHATALLVLKRVDGERQFERKLPEPYRTAWLQMGGGGAEQATSATAKRKEEKKKEQEAFACEFCDKKFKKDHGLAIHLKREHAAEIAAAEEAARLAAEELELGGGAASAKTLAAPGGKGSGDDDGDDDDSPFCFGRVRPPVAAPASREPADAGFSISSAGKFSSQHERRLANEAREEGRRHAKRRQEQYKNSNPYSNVFMSEEHRAQVERVVRAYASADSGGGSGGGRSGHDSGNIDSSSAAFRPLVALGFREQDVSDAIKACGPDARQAEYLDWLCIYAPEEYLPKGFDPRGKQLEVHSSKRRSTAQLCFDLLQEAVSKDLTQSAAAAEAPESPAAHLEALLEAYEAFVNEHVEAEAWPQRAGDAAAEEEEEDLRQMREDELLALESLFEGGELRSENDIELHGGKHVVDRHAVRLGAIEGVPGESVLEIVLVTRSESMRVYPAQSALVVFWNSELNRHINVHMMAELAKHAHATREAPQVYELWDLARNTLPELVAKRPRFAFPERAGTGAHAEATPASDILADDSAAPGAGGRNKRRGGGGGGSRRAPRDNGAELQAEQKRKREQDTAYKAMIDSRSKLPAYSQRYEVLDALGENQVVLIQGETGCGKTTQVPQFILDDAIDHGRGGRVNILCTQPRRLAAIGVAQRVSDERCEKSIGGTVGYQIRLENKTSERTRLSFLTTGILLRRLQGDPDLRGVTHVLVDEVHERNVDTDFLLSILKSLLPRRPDLKLLLMSATMDAAEFCAYFATRSVIKIPGFVHPVKDMFLEDVVRRLSYDVGARPGDEKAYDVALGRIENRLDYALLASLVMDIHRANASCDGSVLVFLSGGAEINRAIAAVQRFAGAGILALPLHGGLSGKDQSRVFQRAPKGQRKVVFSTNVAETSITIDDVVYVIDTGRMKETQYDPVNRMSMLVETWVSRNSARQRRGRAGRVRPGQCFKLYRQRRHDQHFEQAQLPEIHRVPLEQLVLQILSSGLGQPEAFMNTLMEPPPGVSVREAVRLLKDVGAARRASGKVSLSPLGMHLARLPMDVRIAKMLIYGSLLKCADQVLTIAAALSVRNPFVCPPDKRDEANEAKKKLLGGESVEVTQSDHICLLYAYERWSGCGGERDRRKFAEEYFLHHQSLCEVRDLRKDLRRTLEQIGFDGSSSAKCEGSQGILSRESVALVKAALCAGLYPNVINVHKPTQKFSETKGGAVAMAPAAQQLRMLVLRPPEPELDEAQLQSAQASSQSSTLAHLAEAKRAAEEVRAQHPNAGKGKTERVFLHPSSINFHQREYTCPWMVYREKVKTSKVFIRDCTVVPPYSLLMFGGDIEVQHERGTLTVDGWITFRAQARIGVLVRELRKILDRLLEKKINNPSLDIASTDVLLSIKTLLVGAGFTIGS